MRLFQAFTIAAFAALLSDCSGAGSGSSAASGAQGFVPNAPAKTSSSSVSPKPPASPVFTVYVAGTAPGLAANAKLADIAIGADGNAWFADARPGAPAIGRITKNGKIVEFSSGLSPASAPRSLVLGPDGNLWFTDLGTHAIGRITPFGRITEFTAGLSPNDTPVGITAAGDALWFISRGAAPFVGRIGTNGRITELKQFPTLGADGSLAVSYDGNLWFTNHGVDDPTESLTKYNLRTGASAQFPTGLQSVRNPSGTFTAPKTMTIVQRGFGYGSYDVWFTNLFYSTPLYNGPHAIGESSSAGTLSQSFPPMTSEYISGVASDRFGNLWFAGQDPLLVKAALVRMSPAKTFTVYQMPFATSPLGIAAAADGTIWMTAGTGPQSAIVKAAF